MIYEIHKGVPAPPTTLASTIRQMECGESIDIPASKHLGVHTCARSVGARVKTRSNKNGTVTVWRIDRAVPQATGLRPTAAGPARRAAGSAAPPLGDQPGLKPKIEVTAANPDLGLPAGYYAQEDAYSPRFWVEGKPDSAKNDIFS
jgi:hypothetical protein